MMTREQLIDRLIRSHAECVAWRRITQRTIEVSEADMSQARVVVESSLLGKGKPRDELWHH